MNCHGFEVLRIEFASWFTEKKYWTCSERLTLKNLNTYYKTDSFLQLRNSNYKWPQAIYDMTEVVLKFFEIAKKTFTRIDNVSSLVQ